MQLTRINLFSKFLIITCIFLLIFSAACRRNNRTSLTQEQTEKMETIKQNYYIHIVKWEGETLSVIARWYIGHYEDWKLLAIHNPELNPDNIHVGDKVWIPKDDMKTLKQLPAVFLNKASKKKASKKIDRNEKTPPIELYGPKEHKEKQEQEVEQKYYD